MMDLVHSDLWGLMHTVTPDGHRFFLTLIDDHSGVVHVEEEIRNFWYNPGLRADDEDTVWRRKCWGPIKEENSVAPIWFLSWSVKTSSNNSAAYRSLMEMARCMLLEAKMSNRYWGKLSSKRRRIKAVYSLKALRRNIEWTTTKFFRLWWSN